LRYVSPDHGYIDYCYDHARDERWGIRIRPGRATVLCSDGNDLQRMVTVDNSQVPIPIPEFAEPQGMDVLPQVLLAREEYLALYPDSDLAEVLAGRKSSTEALRDGADR
jgi:hypothetical protein